MPTGNTNILPLSGGEIVLYQPDANTRLEVRINNDTVWLTRQQMATLFGRDVKTIGKHINNALREELAVSVQTNNAQTGPVIAKNATTATTPPSVAKFAIVQSEGGRQVERNVEHYSLDMILSVGYRVHSPQGILFRAWANNVLKQYLLQGYAVNRQLIALQQHVDERMTRFEDRLQHNEEQVAFLVRTHQQPQEELFATGCMWDAYSYIANLIRSAKEQITLIDNYCDDKTLTLLDYRAEGVKATIHTTYNKKYNEALEAHNLQQTPIQSIQLPHKIHDRFLIIDSQVYLLGNSLKDMGHTLSAAILTGFTPEEVLSKLK